MQNETEPNYKHSLLNTEAIIVSNNSKEIRKILERELDPYINNIKSELRIGLDHFHKEVQCYNTFIPEIKEVKESLESCRRLIRFSNEINENKFNEQRDKIIELNQVIIDLKDQFDELKNIVTLYESNHDTLQSKVLTCEKMKINYDKFDEKIKEYYMQIEQKLKDQLNKRINDNNISIDTIKSNYDRVINSIMRIESEELRTENEIKELDEKNEKLTNVINTKFNNSITNTSIILKNNEEIKLRFEFVEKKVNDISSSVNQHCFLFEKDIGVLKENNFINIKERQKIIQTINALIIHQQEIELKHEKDNTNLRCPINIKPVKNNNNNLIDSFANAEIESRLCIIEEMLNEHHKILLHHNTKFINSNKKTISLLKEDNINESTNQISSDSILVNINTIMNKK